MTNAGLRDQFFFCERCKILYDNVLILMVIPKQKLLILMVGVLRCNVQSVYISCTKLCTCTFSFLLIYFLVPVSRKKEKKEC